MNVKEVTYKVYVKPYVKVVSMKAEYTLLAGSTHVNGGHDSADDEDESYAKQHFFVDDFVDNND